MWLVAGATLVLFAALADAARVSLRRPTLAVVFFGLAFAGLLASALGVSCKPRYALCESASECSPNACVGGRCVPAPPAPTGSQALSLPAFRHRGFDGGRLAIEKAERHVLRPVSVVWLGPGGGDEVGRFGTRTQRLRLRFAPWVYARNEDVRKDGLRSRGASPVRIRIEEAYLLLHRTGGTTDRVTLTLGADDVGAAEDETDSNGVDVGDVDRPRLIHPLGAEVRVDALSPPWVRMDALPSLRANALKSGVSLVVSASEVSGRGVAFNVQPTSGVGSDVNGTNEGEGTALDVVAPFLELYLTTESLTDAGASDAAPRGGSIRDAATTADARVRKER